MLRAIASTDVIYSLTPPATNQIGQIFVDIATNPATIYVAVSLSPLIYQLISGGGGGGTVTSVAVVNTDGSLTILGSPITTNGTITINADFLFADIMTLMGG